MNWKGLAERLRTACSREVAKGNGWTCYAPAGEAIDVRALMVEYATPADIAEWTAMHGDLREEDALPGGTAGALHDEWPASEVIVWEWVGRSSSWHGSIGVFDAGDGRHYVSRFMEDSPYLVVGAIVPRAGGESFAAFFRDLLADNGHAYGIEVLGSLPASTELLRPDLLSRETLCAAYRKWLDDAEAEGFESWDALRDRLDEVEFDDDEDLGDRPEDEDLSEEEEHDQLLADYCESTVLIVDSDVEDEE